MFNTLTPTTNFISEAPKAISAFEIPPRLTLQVYSAKPSCAHLDAPGLLSPIMRSSFSTSPFTDHFSNTDSPLLMPRSMQSLPLFEAEEVQRPSEDLEEDLPMDQLLEITHAFESYSPAKPESDQKSPALSPIRRSPYLEFALAEAPEESPLYCNFEDSAKVISEDGNDDESVDCALDDSASSPLYFEQQEEESDMESEANYNFSPESDRVADAIDQKQFNQDRMSGPKQASLTENLSSAIAKISPIEAIRIRLTNATNATNTSTYSNEDSTAFTSSEMDQTFASSTTSSPSKKVCCCPHCGEKFFGHVNLGGHVSKKHPGLSPTYKMKMVTRQANVHKRQCRQKAKDAIKEASGAPVHPKLRVYVTQLTKLFLTDSAKKGLTQNHKSEIKLALMKYCASHEKLKLGQ